MKEPKLVISTLFLIICAFSSNAQIEESELRKVFSAVVFLKDSIVRTENYQGKEYEIYLKDKNSQQQFPLKAQISGTGFIVNKDLDNFLVTAQHVALGMTSSTILQFRGRSEAKISVKLDDIKKAGSRWYYHPTADVAVLPLNLSAANNMNSEFSVFDFWNLIDSGIAPNRFEDIIVAGFPLGLGISYNAVSPISKRVRVASDMVILNRFDTGKPNHFFLLDDPSVSGFSGGPVIHFNKSIESLDKKSYLPGSIFVLGLVHGTLNDPKDRAGRFAAIVPSNIIVETINSAPSFEGIYTFKYENGNIWSKVKYKNGAPWTVYSNFDIDGKDQEKGTLKSGSGTLYKYDKDSKLLYVENYEDSKRISLAPVLSTEEFLKFGPMKKAQAN